MAGEVCERGNETTLQRRRKKAHGTLYELSQHLEVNIIKMQLFFFIVVAILATVSAQRSAQQCAMKCNDMRTEVLTMQICRYVRSKKLPHGITTVVHVTSLCCYSIFDALFCLFSMFILFINLV
jgi:hypothetical protein